VGLVSWCVVDGLRPNDDIIKTLREMIDVRYSFHKHCSRRLSVDGLKRKEGGKVLELAMEVPLWFVSG
jgi:hypothetical protein